MRILTRGTAVAGHPLLLAGLSVDALGTGLFAPFSILYFRATIALPLATIGLALSIAALIRFPVTALAGTVIDRLGPRHVVIIANLLQVVGFTSYLVVHSFGFLVAAAIVVQIGNSAFWVAYPGLVHEATRGGSQEPWFAAITGLRFAGLGLGGLAAGAAVAIGGITGYHLVVALNALSFLIAALLIRADGRHAAAVCDARAHIDQRVAGTWATALRDRGFLQFVLLNVSFALLCLAFPVGVPVYLVETIGLPAWIPGGVLAINALLGIFGVAPMLVMIRRRRRSTSLVLSQLVVAFGYGMLLISGAAPVALAMVFAIAAAVCVTVMELVQGAIVPATINDSARLGARGRYNSVYQLAFGTADMITPALITGLLSRGAVVTWGPLGLLALANCAAVGLLSRHFKPLRLRVAERQLATEVVD